jgi:hypothetical protein
MNTWLKNSLIGLSIAVVGLVGGGVGAVALSQGMTVAYPVGSAEAPIFAAEAEFPVVYYELPDGSGITCFEARGGSSRAVHECFETADAHAEATLFAESHLTFTHIKVDGDLTVTCFEYGSTRSLYSCF